MVDCISQFNWTLFPVTTNIAIYQDRFDMNHNVMHQGALSRSMSSPNNSNKQLIERPDIIYYSAWIDVFQEPGMCSEYHSECLVNMSKRDTFPESICV